MHVIHILPLSPVRDLMGAINEMVSGKWKVNYWGHFWLVTARQ